MKRILLICALLMTSVAVSENVYGDDVSAAVDCRITCTIHVADGFGGYVGISGTAGNIFTSCETARERACAEAARNAMNILMDS